MKLGQAAGNIVPVDDGPESIDIFAAIIEVIEVIGMLPDIAEQQRLGLDDSEQVLVLNLDDVEIFAFLH